MATTSFVVDANKTVTVSGSIFTITPSGIPENVTIELGEVTLVNGTPVQVTANSNLTVTVEPFNLSVTDGGNMQSIKLGDDEPITSFPTTLQINSDATLTVTGEPQETYTVTVDYTNTSEPIISNTEA